MTNTSPLDMSRFVKKLEAQGLKIKGTLIDRLGIEFIDVQADYCSAIMPVAGNTQPMGLLHGGASAALAETLGSFAAWLHGGGHKAAMGIELNATHHRSAQEGKVFGQAKAVHLGKTLATYAITIHQLEETGQPPGSLLCTARLTCLIR